MIERRQQQTPNAPKRRMSDKVACPACGCLQSKVAPSHMTEEQQRTEGYWRHRRCQNPECAVLYESEEIARRIIRPGADNNISHTASS